MAKIGGKKMWVAGTALVLLLAFVAVPALSGVASAAPVLGTATVNPSTQWAYGGQGWTNTTLQVGTSTLTWDASFGWTIVFTGTLTPPATVMLEEQRTVGITVSANYTSPTIQETYYYHGQEVDVGFANLTNQSTVTVNGQPVPALGIENASASLSGSISQAVSKTIDGHTASASLKVAGVGQAATSFSPSLGLIPLNLSGVNEWNSTAIGSPSGSWNITYSWADQGFNGTTGSGSGSKVGSLSGTGPVNLTGYKLAVQKNPVFHDGKSRTAIVLIVQGVFDTYDGFILVPHAFDLFGTAAHVYDGAALGSASISAETLYVSSGGPGGLSVTAASSSFGTNAQSVSALATPVTQVSPAAAPTFPSGTVLAQPISVAQATAEATCLTGGCSGTSAAGFPGALLVALVGVAVVVVVGTVGVIEWRSYARRQSQKGLVGGYGEGWPNGVPPAAALSRPPMDPSQGTNPNDDLARRP